MNVENILKVAAAIEDAAKPGAKPKVGFNMGVWHDTGDADQTGHNCGTVCCIGGWTNFLFADDPMQVGMQEAMKSLGLGPLPADDLFCPPRSQYAGSWDSITPAHAVAVLRHLAATGKVDWSIGAPSSPPSDPAPSTSQTTAMLSRRLELRRESRP